MTKKFLSCRASPQFAAVPFDETQLFAGRKWGFRLLASGSALVYNIAKSKPGLLFSMRHK